MGAAKSATVEIPFSVRFPEDLYRQAKAAAAAEDRSMNALIRVAVRQYLDNSQRRGKP